MKLGNFFKIKIKTDFKVVANNNMSEKSYPRIINSIIKSAIWSL